VDIRPDPDPMSIIIKEWMPGVNSPKGGLLIPRKGDKGIINSQ
jgi:hypothetical protein